MLVAHPDWGIVVGNGVDPPERVIWPNGYVARAAGDRAELLDDEGEVIGRVGDKIVAGGGSVTTEDGESFLICPSSIQITP